MKFRTIPRRILGVPAVLLMILLLIMASTGCAGLGGSASGKGAEAQITPVSRDSFYFDTICSIAVYDMEEMSEERAQAAIGEAFKLCASYENMLSRTKEGTDIWRINHAAGEAVECAPQTAELIALSIPYCEISGGSFDITVGRVTDLWDFHEAESDVPPEDAVKEAVASVDYRKVEVLAEDNEVTEAAGSDAKGETAGDEGDDVKPLVRLGNPEAELDLGAVAKGYIADRLCEVLREQGVTSAVISLGGNIACIGGKPVSGSGTKPFTIGVETPFSNRTEILGTIPCENGTVVTSGIYERCFEKDGVLYHHILDARTGYPCETDVIGVTITGKEGMSMACDAMATVCLLVGSEKGLALIEATDGLEALFVTKDGMLRTSGMTFEER